MLFVVIISNEDGTSNDYWFDTYKEAKEFSLKQKNRYCSICKSIAYKDEFTNSIEEVVEKGESG